MHENYLAHYGVKGMKWGVRKKKEIVKDYFDYRDEQIAKSSGRSKQEVRDRRRRAIKIAAVVGGTVATAAAVTAGTYAYRRYKATYGHNVFKKGATIQRLLRPDLLDGGFSKSGLDYATGRKLDNATFPGLIGKATHTFRGTAKEDLRLANQFDLGKVVAKNMGQLPKSDREKLLVEILSVGSQNKGSMWRGSILSKKEYAELMSGIGKDSMSKKGIIGLGKVYNAMLGKDMHRNSALGQLVKKELSAKGFKGITDWHDVRNNRILGRAPAILFDIRQNTKMSTITKSKAITKGAVVQMMFSSRRGLTKMAVAPYTPYIAIAAALWGAAEANIVDDYRKTKRLKKLKNEKG